MLDAKTIEIVKASAPVLAARGRDVTTRMYELMFAANPEVKPLFNNSHQVSGQQPVALAAAVHAYAGNIEKAEVLMPALKLIAHKHASLGIRPDHYPIVARHLLQALAEVLGLGQVQLDAWAKAYGFLADALIGLERDLYAEAAGQQGGWDGYRSFIVDRIERESDVIKSFYLRPADGGPLASYVPGQYLTLLLTFAGGNIVTRNYSLSDAPGGDCYRISVKAERRGEASLRDGLASAYLHDFLVPGMTLEVRAPMGSFTLNPATDRPVVLLSGGVGVTAMLSMLNSIVASHPDLKTHFIHAALNAGTHAFGDHVRKLAAEHPNVTAHICYSHPGAEALARGLCDKVGFVTQDWLAGILPGPDCDFYLCGPAPFMRQMYQLLTRWGVPPSQIAYEFFGPADELSGIEDEQQAA